MTAHGTYTQVDGKPAVRFERELRHPPETVWRLITDPGELAHWFPCAVELDLRVGGAMRFVFPEDMVLDGEVLTCEPPAAFAFRWGADRLDFTLEPRGAGTLLTLVHVLEEEGAPGAAKTAAGWHLCLDALAARADGAQPGQAPAGPTPEWRERYAEYVAAGVPEGAEIPG
jgi:uncharacterized protein YndB with AHSA1/START domain